MVGQCAIGIGRDWAVVEVGLGGGREGGRVGQQAGVVGCWQGLHDRGGWIAGWQDRVVCLGGKVEGMVAEVELLAACAH